MRKSNGERKKGKGEKVRAKEKEGTVERRGG